MRMIKKILLGAVICMTVMLCIPNTSNAAAKATFTVTNGFVFDGKTHNLLKVKSKTKDATIQFRTYKDSKLIKNWNDNVPNAKDAGTYTVKYRLKAKGSSKYGGAKTAGTVKISPKNPKVECTVAKNLSYNTKSQYLITDYLVENGTIQFKVMKDQETVTDWNKNKPKATDAGTYVIYYRVNSTNGNYNSISGDVYKKTVTIKKANPDLKINVRTRLTYNRYYQNVIESVSIKGGTLMYRINAGKWTQKEPTVKDQGKYIVSWKVVGNENYEDVEEKYTVVEVKSQSISEKDVVVELDEYSYRYDGDPKEPTPTVKLKEGNRILTLTNDEYKVDYENNTLVGKGTVKIEGIKNYIINTQVDFWIIPSVTSQKIYLGSTLNIDKITGGPKGTFVVEKKYEDWIKISEDGQKIITEENKQCKIQKIPNIIPVAVRVDGVDYGIGLKLSIQKPNVKIKVKKENKKYKVIAYYETQAYMLKGYAQSKNNDFTVYREKNGEWSRPLVTFSEKSLKKKRIINIKIQKVYGDSKGKTLNSSEFQTIKVDMRPTSLKLNKHKVKIYKKKPVYSKLKATEKSAYCALDGRVKWTSSNSKVVTVDKNGKLKAKKKGKATIVVRTIDKAKDGKYKYDKCTVYVK